MLERFVNGPLLRASEWGAGVMTIHPSTHRLYNALGLSAGMIVGRAVMDRVAGQTLSGEPVTQDETPFLLKPFHNMLSYDHFSDDPADRWKKVGDFMAPALLGGVGAGLGSYAFAHNELNRRHEAVKIPWKMTLDQAEQVADMVMANPLRRIAMFNALPGSGSGRAVVTSPLLLGTQNYGATLSMAFMKTVDRNKVACKPFPLVSRIVSDNRFPEHAYGAVGTRNILIKYLKHNPTAQPDMVNYYVERMLDPWFRETMNEGHVQAFTDKINALRSEYIVGEGGIPEARKAEFEVALKKTLLNGEGLENTLRSIDPVALEPAKARIGRDGFTEKVARWLGGERALNSLERQYKMVATLRAQNAPVEAIKEQLSAIEKKAGSMDFHAADTPHWKALGIGTAATFGLIWLANYTRHGDSKEVQEQRKSIDSRRHGGILPSMFDDSDKDIVKTQNKLKGERLEASQVKLEREEGYPGHAREHLLKAEDIRMRREKGESSWAQFINNKPLKAMEWTVQGFNSPDSWGMHRSACAVGLTAGGYAGMKLMEALTGFDLRGQPVEQDKVFSFLQRFYKKLPYNPHADTIPNRWMKVAHFLVPSVLGAAGVVACSEAFFSKRKRKLKHAETIEEYDQKATMAEAKPWTALTALTAPMVAPSGFPFLPLVNYGTSLHTRYALAAGRKMTFPWLGEKWTGPHFGVLGPGRQVDEMIEYAVHNRSVDPEFLHPMAENILKSWFENATDKQVDEFVNHFHEIRDKYLADGGIPEDYMEEARKELVQHFKGTGLEKTLRELHLDPMVAHLGNNGWAEKIAKFMGGKEAIDGIHEEYHEKYQTRLEHERERNGHVQKDEMPLKDEVPLKSVVEQEISKNKAPTRWAEKEELAAIHTTENGHAHHGATLGVV